MERDGLKKRFENTYKKGLWETLGRLAFLAGIHDMGKANLGFQLKTLTPQTLQAGYIRDPAAHFRP